MKRSECSIKSEGKDITVALTVSENKTKTEIELLTQRPGLFRKHHEKPAIRQYRVQL